MVSENQPRPIVARNVASTPLKRDQVLAFVIEQIAHYGLAPTMGEIARELSVSNTRAKQLVCQLVHAGSIERVPGSVRGLRVRDVTASRRHLAEVLRRLGWSAADPLSALRCVDDQPIMVAILTNVASAEVELATSHALRPL